MNKQQWRRFLLGRHTASFLAIARADRNERPAKQLHGESRWEIRDSDTGEPGPYAMPDEDATDHLTSSEYMTALQDLSASCETQPVGSSRLQTDPPPS
jgi:hypothetical protein